jgi:protein tyrosine kinase modulator
MSIRTKGALNPGITFMLQYASSPPQQVFAEEAGSGGLEHYIALAKRRLFYFLIPFVVALVLGFLIVAIQRPIYQAEGKILVETQDIPTNLVQPTVIETANQRIQVIQQRIMTRDNLMEIVKKFGLFPSQQQWMSSSQLLDLMRERTRFKLVDLALPTQQNNLIIAFTLGFEYENAGTAARVANEFLTLVLSEDARNRTNRATETTKFLEQESKRLQGVLDSVQAQIKAQIAAAALKPQDPVRETTTQIKDERAELTKLKMQLVQKASTYSDAHPEVKALKKRIAALEKIVSERPDASRVAAADIPSSALSLKQQLTSAEANLDEANHKLTTARLGETLERNQQSERLQVIEQPAVPQKPIKPDRPKLLALAFVLALVVGAGSVTTAESLDKSIRGTQDLAGVVDSRLIVAIPYISTRAETLRKKGRLRLLLAMIVLLVLAAIAVALYLGLSIDLSSWVDRSWLDQLTRLSK